MTITYEVMNAHPLNVVIIIATIMVTPMYALGTYAFSGASLKKGTQVGIAFLIFGAFMSWVCLSDVPRRLGLPGNLIVPVAWIIFSAVLFLGREWFLSQRLSQKWLVGLQILR
jgi:hypothetical protein